MKNTQCLLSMDWQRCDYKNCSVWAPRCAHTEAMKSLLRHHHNVESRLACIILRRSNRKSMDTERNILRCATSKKGLLYRGEAFSKSSIYWSIRNVSRVSPASRRALKTLGIRPCPVQVICSPASFQISYLG